MTRIRRPAHPSSFSPTLHEVWRQALVEPRFRLKANDHKTAVQIRTRLYALRKSLNFHGEELGRNLSHLRISLLVSPSTGDHYLEFSPIDSHLEDIIAPQLANPSLAPDPVTFTDAPPVATELNSVEDNPYLTPKPKKRQS